MLVINVNMSISYYDVFKTKVGKYKVFGIKRVNIFVSEALRMESMVGSWRLKERDSNFGS